MLAVATAIVGNRELSRLIADLPLACRFMLWLVVRAMASPPMHDGSRWRGCETGREQIQQGDEPEDHCLAHPCNVARLSAYRVLVFGAGLLRYSRTAPRHRAAEG